VSSVSASRSGSGSGEHLVDVGHGITLCYERFGDPSDPPLLLIMGLGQQLLAWPDAFVQGLVARGFQVVIFDNRDVGRSTHATNRPPRLTQLMIRRFDDDQYDLGDLTDDAAGLLDALDLRPAHVVGVSMGGMIAQTLAARYPDHVRSLVSIMSSTGVANAGWVAPSTLRLLMTAPPRDREAAAERAVKMFRHIGSAGFPFDEQSIRERSLRAYDRDPRGAVGTGRQMAAILKSGNRTDELQGITAPTLVIHGDRDRMVHPSGGRATARAIPGARLVTIEGMGHDLPAGAFSRLVELIGDHATQADQARQSPAAA
jgi:pimeloyl-ACP methyl ester carboxylesterase